MTLMLAAASCATGMWMNATFLMQGFLWTILLIFGMGYLIYNVLNTGQPESVRITYLLAFAGLMGLQVGPFINAVLEIYPGLISQAALYTGTSFGTFSAVSLFSQRRSWLFLGGIIGNVLSAMAVYALISWFTGNVLGLGYVMVQLFITCCMIIYDTQVIVEQAERGRRDVPAHTLILFEDLFRMFIQVVRILIEMQENGNKNKKRR